MGKYIKVGISGLLISFLGTLPLGTLNITAFSVAASKNIYEAIWFAIAVVLVELVVVRLTLFGDKKINFNGKLSFYLIPLAALFLVYLAIQSFMAINEVSEMNTSINLFPAIQSSFILGLLLSTLNPLQIPFWMGWNRVLIAKNKLQNTGSSYASYMFGIGTGTLSGLLVFIFLGSRIFENYEQYHMIVSLLMGFLYLGFSIYIMFLLYKKHLKLKIQ